MRIGKLNELYDDIHFHVTFAGTELVPAIETPGNPVNGQPLVIRWKDVRDEEVQLHIKLPQVCFVDTVVMHLGEKAALTSVQLCRESEILYHFTAETGKNCKTDELRLEAGELCQELSIVLCSDFATLELLSLDIYGAVEDGVDLFPTPDAVSLGEGVLPAEHFSTCCADSPDGIRAAQILCEKFSDRTGVQLQIGQSGQISFITNASVVPDGYELDVTETQTQIRASNLRGFVCGAETFIKLIKDGCIHTAKVSDSPSLPFRGVHLFVPSEAKMDFAKRLIKHLISPMGYNTIIMQVSGGMVYESHPNISAAFANAVQMHKKGLWPAFPHDGIAEGKPITKEQLREFITYIRSFGIDVIPEVQSLGHVQYMTHAYPEIAEIAEEEAAENVDTREEDMLPSKFYRHSYCPSNERSYEILFDILDEIIEVFQPKEYVHMGHDEVREIGVCSKCKAKSPAELFAADINRIHDYLANKGLKMMIWADMLQPVTKYQTPPAIDMIPKDIVLLDFIWYFHLDKDIEDNLLEKGFDVIIGNLYSSHFPRYESRIRKPGIQGGQISTWVATSEYELQKEGKLYDLFMTAQMLWSASYSKNYKLVYDRMISETMPQLREDLNAMKYPSRQSGASTGCIGQNMISFPPNLPVEQQVEFTLDGEYDSLVFWHTALRKITRLPWSELDVVARYILRYEGGSTEEIPVTYGGNIGYWNRRQNQPLAHKFYRHTGYTAVYYCDSETTRTADGKLVTLYRYEYLPKQKKPIRSITLVQDPAFDAKVFLRSVEGVIVGVKAKKE